MPTQAEPPELERLLDVRETAGVLHVSLNGVKRLIYAGELPVVRVGWRVLIKPEDLREFIEARRERRGASP
jgi:excisionase family DNA binding protein